MAHISERIDLDQEPVVGQRVSGRTTLVVGGGKPKSGSFSGIYLGVKPSDWDGQPYHYFTDMDFGNGSPVQKLFGYPVAGERETSAHDVPGQTVPSGPGAIRDANNPDADDSDDWEGALVSLDVEQLMGFPVDSTVAELTLTAGRFDDRDRGLQVSIELTAGDLDALIKRLRFIKKAAQS